MMINDDEKALRKSKLAKEKERKKKEGKREKSTQKGSPFPEEGRKV